MSEKKGFNRRDFLKVLGAGTGLVASGCAKDLPEKIIPYVIQPDEVVPGNATWYAGTCNECSAGCGVLVRTKEGRVLKVEGNPQHPVNKGGLCSIGQSSVQAVYDPDRVRTPLMRKVGEPFKAATWMEAVSAVSEKVTTTATSGKKTVFLTKELSGSEKKILKQFASKIKGSEIITYELLNENALNFATETVYGANVKANFDFSKAEVVLGIGADYLETWVSPVKFTKEYSSKRVPEKNAGKISKVYHVEPRLSLTASNADVWLKNSPSSEISFLKLVLSNLVKKRTVNGELKEAAKKVLIAFDESKALAETDIKQELFTDLINDLINAKSSLVVAGGSSVSEYSGEAAILALMINDCLGNIGKSVLLSKEAANISGESDIITGTPDKLSALIEDMKGNKVGTLFLIDINPAFSIPRSSGFDAATGKVETVVSISRSLDETSKLSNVILPLSTNFETWSDSEPLPGVFAINQPAMQPLHKTQGLGDIILSLDASDKLEGAGQFKKKYTNFRDYIVDQWKDRLGDSSSNFEEKFQDFVSKGGDLKDPKYLNASLPSDWAKASKIISDLKVETVSGISCLTFPTVHYGDGRGANRPWLHEVPDPMTTSVWGSWIEIHPDTAEKHGINHGDTINIKGNHGGVDAPAFVTKYIHPNLVALPLGLGHDSFGRFGSGVGVNPLKMMPELNGSKSIKLITRNASIRPSVALDSLVELQFSNTQLKRGFIRSVTEEKFEKTQKEAPGNVKLDPHNPHAGALALGTQAERPQMYKQMEHPLYRWGMTIDLSACTGCSACVTACYAENNIAVVGKQIAKQGREMSWLRIARYTDGPDEHPVTGFGPMLCQHCGNAPCEPVCPVYATYHAEDGLNTMVYNRCVGTRYCSNNCNYKVRRFNWFNYEWPEPLNWQLNPDVTVRSVGIMEKCTFCIQRVREAQVNSKDEGRPIQDGEVKTACQSSCPADAIKFGNLLDEKSEVSKWSKSKRGYKTLDFELNTQPAITYLAKVTHKELEPVDSHGDASHGDASHGAAHEESSEHKHG